MVCSGADQAKAPWLLLTLADQESAATERFTRKGCPALSATIPSLLRVADQATHPLPRASAIFPGLSRQWATSASARLSKSRLPLHIASLSMTDGIADSVWLKATRLVSRLRSFGGLRASRDLSSATNADAMWQ